MTSLRASGNEKTATDQFVRRMVEALGVDYWEQGDGPEVLRRALSGASKSLTGKGHGKPEFVFLSGGFLVIIEDKRETSRTIVEADGAIDVTHPARADYAVNGAVHYAMKVMAQAPQFDRAFAIGVTGTEHHHEIVPVFLGVGSGPVRMDAIDNLAMFAPEAIREFHRVAVMGETPREELDLDAARAVAKALHNEMRTYTSLQSMHKAPTVSAILLALKSSTFDLSQLRGSLVEKQTDGWVIYRAAEAFLHEAELQPAQKIGALLDQFKHLCDDVMLNQPRHDLGGKTPLYRFALTLSRDVLSVMSQSTFDVLGNFYGEFVKYGGSDGNSLGIVLTPHHITTLMADIIEVNQDDYVLDPTAGTAGFLIAAMGRMMFQAGDDEMKREEIRRDRLFGIELQTPLFAVGVTNMILRGDGKANFRRDDLFHVNVEELRGAHGFTKVLINPPYSQAKNAQTRHLSEMSFIREALSLLNAGGRLAAIVPLSVMVGKTKEDKEIKREILSRHTLDAVITMNPETFHGVGTHVVIAIFTAGVAHPPTKRSIFINFKRDGYRVQSHRGLVGDGTQESRREHLLAVLRGDRDDDTSFVVRTAVTAEDEWQHPYFYFDETVPGEEEIEKVVAGYLTWRVASATMGSGVPR